MGRHYQYNDVTFEKQYADCSFPPDLFTHEAHLRLAWIHISKYGLEQAIENLCQQIKRYDQFHGKGTKFHTTITVAAARIVAHYMNNSEAQNFHEFIKEYPDLTGDFIGMIKKHYSEKRLWNEAAKDNYLKPDKSSF